MCERPRRRAAKFVPHEGPYFLSLPPWPCAVVLRCRWRASPCHTAYFHLACLSSRLHHSSRLPLPRTCLVFRSFTALKLSDLAVMFFCLCSCFLRSRLPQWPSIRITTSKWENDRTRMHSTPCVFLFTSLPRVCVLMFEVREVVSLWYYWLVVAGRVLSSTFD